MAGPCWLVPPQEIGRSSSVSYGVPGSWCPQGFVWVLWVSLASMGFVSKCDFALPTILLGLLLCPWMWDIFFWGGSSILLSMTVQQVVATLEFSEKMSLTPTIVWLQAKLQGGNIASTPHQQKIGLKIYWAWPHPTEQDPNSPLPVLPIKKLPQTSYPYPLEGRQNGNHNQRKLTKLKTCIAAWSNSMKLWAMSCRATQDGRVLVESSDKTWSIEKGNGNILLQYSCLEDNTINRMKRQKDMTLKDELSGLVGTQYATGEEWRNSSREWRGLAKVKTTPSSGCHWWWK